MIIGLLLVRRKNVTHQSSENFSPPYCGRCGQKINQIFETENEYYRATRSWWRR
ncbi:MAG: hypothetical protein J0L93_09165 [Deltaproteobacteria bacterium]|nr:hypothetical protein [Deltaproteobacteria bacterium]